MGTIVIGTLMNLVFTWGYIKLDDLFDKSKFARCIRKILWQNRIDTQNLETYKNIIGDL